MQKDKQLRINFEKVVLEKVDLEINPNYTLKEAGIPVDISVKVTRNLIKSQKLLKLSLNVFVFKEAEDPPLRVSLIATGYFSVKKDGDFKTLEEFSQIQAPALVFPFVRETIANLTMRTDYPPLLLPPANITVLIGKTSSKKRVKKKNM